MPEKNFFERITHLPKSASAEELEEIAKKHRYEYYYIQSPNEEERKGILIKTQNGMFLYHQNKEKHSHYIISNWVEGIVNTHHEQNQEYFPPEHHHD